MNSILYGSLFLASSLLQQPPQHPMLTLLYPPGRANTTNAPAVSITGLFDRDSIGLVEILVPKEFHRTISVLSKKEKGDFALVVRDLFPKDFILGTITVVSKAAGKEDQTLSYDFERSEEVDLRKFWDSIPFRSILARIYQNEVVEVSVNLLGWSRNRIVVSSAAYQAKHSNVFSFQSMLAPGKVRFYIIAKNRDNATIAVDSVDFFYATTASGDAPPEFVHASFHKRENESFCGKCHREILPSNPQQSTVGSGVECSSCHDVLSKGQSTHPPAETWNCVVCHDPQSSPRFQLYPEKDYSSGICFECHRSLKEEIDSQKTVHGIAFECRTCHDSHASVEKNLLVGRVRTICAVCHEKIAHTPHPVTGHPLDGRPDPSSPGRELSCASCHNPHASQYPALLRTESSQLCARCHQMH